MIFVRKKFASFKVLKDTDPCTQTFVAGAATSVPGTEDRFTWELVSMLARARLRDPGWDREL